MKINIIVLRTPDVYGFVPDFGDWIICAEASITVLPSIYGDDIEECCGRRRGTTCISNGKAVSLTKVRCLIISKPDGILSLKSGCTHETRTISLKI
jgi:hypothetical protein